MTCFSTLLEYIQLTQEFFYSILYAGPRKNLPPLLLKLTERIPEELGYLGVSYGITYQLFKFWKRAGFVPVYLRYY